MRAEMIMERLALRAPAEARCNWWAIGVFDGDGELVSASNLIVPEQRLGDAVAAARVTMLAADCDDVMIIETEPPHTTLYEERGGAVLVNRLGA